MDPEVKSPPALPRRNLYLMISLVLVLVMCLGLIFYLRTTKNRGFVSGFVSDPESNLTSTNGRTNLVFLGLGDADQAGGDLTDSIIFISLSHPTHSISILSIPRDIWVNTMQAKVNTAYHYGEERREGGGLDLAKSAVSEIVGQPVHYALALDFVGFVQAVDAVGGLDIEVTRAFDDYKYPIPGKETVEPESDRYEHLHFDAGPTHLDGATALKFSRSRHAEGEEGTDFARSARQQQILLAFKNKLLTTQTLLDFETLKTIIAGFRNNLDTDLADGEFGSLFHFFVSYSQSKQNVTPLSLDNLLFSPKYTSPYQGQWVLVPSGTWPELHDYVAKNLAE